MTVLLQALVLVLLFHITAASRSIITSLPGFPGDLPFRLETGYIGVGDSDNVQLFYYFIESEGSPVYDPLVLWLTGGPGCSGFSALVYENIGPLSFDYAHSFDNKPQLKLNPYSWTKVANIIFIDAPVGTGFSYAKTWDEYPVLNDTISAAQTYQFLRKWLVDHPRFISNPLYIAGDSYSGIVLPIIVEEISDGNQDGLEPAMNLQGYVLGNPVTDEAQDANSQVLFAYVKALISYDLYQSTKRNCRGEYENVDPNNAVCLYDLELVNECLQDLDYANILEPLCTYETPKPIGRRKWHPQEFSNKDPKDLLLPSSQVARPWCRGYNYISSYIWANDKTVQYALHVAELWENRMQTVTDIKLGCFTWLEDFQKANKPALQTAMQTTKIWKPASALKLNVDGAYLEHRINGGVGGILRDSMGHFTSAYLKPVNYVSSAFHVELLAIREGIDLVQKFKLQKVVIETDCLLAVNAIHSSAPNLSSLGSLINDIQAAMRCNPGVQITFASRSCNRIAHRLANMAYESAQGVVWSDSIPDCIIDLVQQECTPF